MHSVKNEKGNKRYLVLKFSEERQNFSAGQETLIGLLLKKVATDTKTLSVIEALHLNHICSICRNIPVKVHRAPKHMRMLINSILHLIASASGGFTVNITGWP